MALRAIRLNRDPVLYRKCREVEQVDDKVRQLLDDMLQTLHATSNGAAIAAPQVGVLRRLVVIDMGELSGGVLKLVNPKIIHKQGRQVCDEGCLSFPDQWAQTVRPYQVTVQALDENGQESDMYAATYNEEGRLELHVTLRSETSGVRTWRLYLDGNFKSEATAVLQ